MGHDLALTITGIGAQVSGFGSTLSPDSIMAYGYTMSSTLWSSVSLGTFLLQPPTTIICLIVGCIIFVLFVWIAITLLMVIIEVFRRRRRFDLFALRSLPLCSSAGRRVGELDTGRQHADLSNVPDPEYRPTHGRWWVNSMGVSIAGPPGSPIPHISNFLNPFLVLAQTFIFWALAVKMLLIMRHKVDRIISPFVGISGVVRSALSSANAGADAFGTPAAVSCTLESGVDTVSATLKAMLLATLIDNKSSARVDSHEDWPGRFRFLGAMTAAEVVEAMIAYLKDRAKRGTSPNKLEALHSLAGCLTL